MCVYVWCMYCSYEHIQTGAHAHGDQRPTSGIFLYHFSSLFWETGPPHWAWSSLTKEALWPCSLLLSPSALALQTPGLSTGVQGGWTQSLMLVWQAPCQLRHLPSSFHLLSRQVLINVAQAGLELVIFLLQFPEQWKKGINHYAQPSSQHHFKPMSCWASDLDPQLIGSCKPQGL